MKMEGLKFLRRNRALEDDEEFLARATAGAICCSSTITLRVDVLILATE